MSTAVKCRWMRWAEIPWLSRSEAGGGALQLAERLLEASLDAAKPIPFLSRRLPEITTEFSAQWCSVYKRTPQWTRIAESGRRGFEEIPRQFLDEALDRDAGGFYGATLADEWRILAAPLGAGRSSTGDLLLMAGRNLTDNVLCGRRGRWTRARRVPRHRRASCQKPRPPGASGKTPRGGDRIFADS